MRRSGKRSLRPGRGLLTGLTLALACVHSAHPQGTDSLIARDLVIQQWTVEQGLPGNTISALHRPVGGYLWLATGNGIARFDGLRFTTYSTANTAAIPTNRFAAIYEDRREALWFLTDQSHVVRFADGGFGVVHGLPEGRASTIYKRESSERFHESRGRLWLGTDAGLSEIGGDSLIAVIPDQIKGPVRVVSGSERGPLWLGTYSGDVIRYDPESGAVRTYSTQTGLPRARVHDVHIARDGTVWVGTRDGAFRLRTDGVFEPVTHRGQPWIANVQAIFEDPAGGIHFAVTRTADQRARESSGWFVERDGILHRFPAISSADLAPDSRLYMDSDGRVWRFQGPDLYRGHELVFSAESVIMALLIDDSDTIWIGTEAHGLFRLRSSTFRVLSIEEGLPGRQVSSVFEDEDGTVWVGTDEGIVRVRAGRVRPFDLMHGYRDLAPTYFARKGYSRIRAPGSEVWGLHQDRSGTMWIGTNYEHCRVVGNRCRLQDLGDIPQDLYENGAALHQDRRGRFWIGTKWGLIQGETTSGPWTRLTTEEGLANDWITSIHEAEDGVLFFGTYGGGIMRLADGGFEPIGTEQGLASNSVLTLSADADGDLWVGTQDRGACRLHREEGGISCVAVGDGLFDNTIFGIVDDRIGRVWMSSSRGIFWVSREQLDAFRVGETPSISSIGYTERDGLRNRQANGGVQPAAIRTSDGRLWFATQDGVAVVDPTRVNPAPDPFPVVVERVEIDGVVVPNSGRVVVPPGRGTLNVSWTALSFLHPEDVRFRYRLEGFDPGWSPASASRTATFTNLPPGSYTLHIGAGVAGDWRQAETTLAVEKLPLFRQTGWFYALLLILLVLTGYWTIEYRVRSLRASKNRLEALVAERTRRIADQNAELELQKAELARVSELKSRFLTNISHEFRTPLTLTLGPLQDLQGGRHGVLPKSASEEVGRIRRNATRLLTLINQLLDLSTIEAGALMLQVRRGDFVSFARQVTALFESTATRRSLDLKFETTVDHLPLDFDADRLEKVLVNLIANAIKFSEAPGTIAVRVAVGEAGEAEITVSDTGQGIPPEHLAHVFERFHRASGPRRGGNGIGLTWARELVELHGGSIDVASTLGEGTVFTIRLPQPDTLPETVHGSPVFDNTTAPGLVDEPGNALAGHPETVRRRPDLTEDDPLVLVVEDNIDMRTYIRSHLTGFFSVAEASDGAQGLDRARELIPDLVISDVMMPEVDGLDMVRALRADPLTSHIPLILLTADATGDTKLEGLETGADAYLVKPFDADELRLRIRKLIERRRELQRKYSDRVLVLGATEIDLPSHEVALLERISSVIEKRMGESGFGIDELAHEAGLSRRQLLRKVRALTGETPGAMVRRMRLERAAQLLRSRVGSVKEIAHRCGFGSVPHFTQVFGERYGVRPSAYAEPA